MPYFLLNKSVLLVVLFVLLCQNMIMTTMIEYSRTNSFLTHYCLKYILASNHQTHISQESTVEHEQQ